MTSRLRQPSVGLPRDWTRQQWLEWGEDLIATHSRQQVAETLADMGDQAWVQHDVLRDVATAGVEFDDSRLGYVTVQVDRATWDALARYRGLPDA